MENNKITTLAKEKINIESTKNEIFLELLNKKEIDINDFLKNMLIEEIDNISEERIKQDIKEIYKVITNVRKKIQEFLGSDLNDRISKEIKKIIMEKIEINDLNSNVENVIEEYLFSKFFPIENLSYMSKISNLKESKEFKINENRKQYMNKKITFEMFKKNLKYYISLKDKETSTKIIPEYYLQYFFKLLTSLSKTKNIEIDFDDLSGKKNKLEENKRTRTMIDGELDSSVLITKTTINEEIYLTNNEKEAFLLLIKNKILEEDYQKINENFDGNITKLIQEKLQKIDFFEKIEIDKDSKLTSVFLLLNDIIELKVKVPARMLTLKIRKLGNYKAEGLYIDRLKLLAIDFENPDPFIHEFFHAIHFAAMERAKKEDKIAIEIIEMLENLANYFSKKITFKDNMSHEKRLYYKNETEIIARLGELGYLLNLEEKIKTNVEINPSKENFLSQKEIYFNFDQLKDNEINMIKEFTKFMLYTDFEQTLVNDIEILKKIKYFKNELENYKKNEIELNKNIAPYSQEKRDMNKINRYILTLTNKELQVILNKSSIEEIGDLLSKIHYIMYDTLGSNKITVKDFHLYNEKREELKNFFIDIKKITKEEKKLIFYYIYKNYSILKFFKEEKIENFLEYINLDLDENDFEYVLDLFEKDLIKSEINIESKIINLYKSQNFKFYLINFSDKILNYYINDSKKIKEMIVSPHKIFEIKRRLEEKDFLKIDKLIKENIDNIGLSIEEIEEIIKTIEERNSYTILKDFYFNLKNSIIIKNKKEDKQNMEKLRNENRSFSIEKNALYIDTTSFDNNIIEELKKYILLIDENKPGRVTKILISKNNETKEYLKIDLKHYNNINIDIEENMSIEEILNAIKLQYKNLFEQKKEKRRIQTQNNNHNMNYDY